MASSPDRAAPRDLTAERAALGAVLLDGDGGVIGELRNLVSPDDLSKRHAAIYQAMIRLADRGAGIDPTTLGAELGDELEAGGGHSYLSSLMDGLPRAPLVGEYANIVLECARRRRLAGLGQDLCGAALAGDDTTPTTAAIADETNNVTGVVPCRSMAEILEDPDVLRPPAVVVPGFAYRGRVTLIAAQEKGGKSTMEASQTAAVSRGRPWLAGEFGGEPGDVLWVGLEEHLSDIVRRFVDWNADPNRVYIANDLALVADPLAALRALVVATPFALVVVDTLAALVERLAPDSGSAAAWTPVMAAIARMARETNAAIVLAHHTRKSDGRYRDSTAIGAGVDAIIEMSAGDDPAVRRLRCTARWPVEDFSVLLTAAGYERATGELSIDARVLAWVRTHRGCSKRELRGGVTGRTAAIYDAVDRLAEAGAIEVRTEGRAKAIYPVEEPVPWAADDPDLPVPETVPDDFDGPVPGKTLKAVPDGTLTLPLAGTAGTDDRYPAQNLRVLPRVPSVPPDGEEEGSV